MNKSLPDLKGVEHASLDESENACIIWDTIVKSCLMRSKVQKPGFISNKPNKQPEEALGGHERP